MAYIPAFFLSPFTPFLTRLPSRCRELVEKEGVDITKGDEENITVLHWVAIKNRIPVVSYFLQKGADVNAIGGELKSPPVHWATRWALIEIPYR